MRLMQMLTEEADYSSKEKQVRRLSGETSSIKARMVNGS